MAEPQPPAVPAAPAAPGLPRLGVEPDVLAQVAAGWAGLAAQLGTAATTAAAARTTTLAGMLGIVGTDVLTALAHVVPAHTDQIRSLATTLASYGTRTADDAVSYRQTDAQAADAVSRAGDDPMSRAAGTGFAEGLAAIPPSTLGSGTTDYGTGTLGTGMTSSNYAHSTSNSGLGSLPVPGTANTTTSERYGLHPAAAVGPTTTGLLPGDPTALRLPNGQTVTAPNPRAAAAVTAALRCLGTPYVWGGNTPGQGLDCSGLTKYAYAQAGMDLPRLADQQDIGRRIPLTQAAPGDLLVWDGHVAMVVGPGQMIEAGNPVQLSPIRTSNQGETFQGVFRPSERPGEGLV